MEQHCMRPGVGKAVTGSQQDPPVLLSFRSQQSRPVNKRSMFMDGRSKFISGC